MDVVTRKKIKAQAFSPGAVNRLIAFCPTGRILAALNDMTCMLWDIETGQPTSTFKLPVASPEQFPHCTAIAFSSHKKWFVAGPLDYGPRKPEPRDHGTTYFWDTKSSPIVALYKAANIAQKEAARTARESQDCEDADSIKSFKVLGPCYPDAVSKLSCAITKLTVPLSGHDRHIITETLKKAAGR